MTKAMNEPHYLTKQQLADHLGAKSTRLIDQLVRKKIIPVIRLGHRSLRFELPKVIAAINSSCEVRSR